jgi:urease accessory protein
MRDANFFLLLQVNDAAFPIGGYSHSYGLETYIRRREITDADTAGAYIKANLKNAFLYSELLPAHVAYDLARKRDMSGLLALEALSAASRAPVETRQASQKLGGRFAKTAAPLLRGDDAFFYDYTRIAGRGGCTHPVAYGVFCAVADIARGDALAAFLFAQTSAMTVNCVKTIPLSQTDGQNILLGCHPFFTELLLKIERLTDDDLFRSCPGLEIHAMLHETLYSRLYMS